MAHGTISSAGCLAEVSRSCSAMALSLNNVSNVLPETAALLGTLANACGDLVKDAVDGAGFDSVELENLPQHIKKVFPELGGILKSVFSKKTDRSEVDKSVEYIIGFETLYRSKLGSSLNGLGALFEKYSSGYNAKNTKTGASEDTESGESKAVSGDSETEMKDTRKKDIETAKGYLAELEKLKDPAQYTDYRVKTEYDQFMAFKDSWDNFINNFKTIAGYLKDLKKYDSKLGEKLVQKLENECKSIYDNIKDGDVFVDRDTGKFNTAIDKYPACIKINMIETGLLQVINKFSEWVTKTTE